METSVNHFQALYDQAGNNPWAKRILEEIAYLYQLSKTMDGQLDAKLAGAVAFLQEEVDKEGTISKSTALKAEQMLSDLQGVAKSLEMTFAAHAHIDMNWMWGYNETIGLTIDTFHTMLKLLKEYPYFHFSQSQASTYEIVERYCPEMLEEIKHYIKEGRWEVTASSWVENDKNLSGPESMARHLLYTRKYLSKLLEISEDAVKLDFEPDTFGHCENIPEVLNQGGVKYYYHCRGYDGHYVYKWRSPSGGELLVYREPTWYNYVKVDESIFRYVPEFCHKYGIRHVLKLYGVGDHGGGPSRRDVEKIADMATWPLGPAIVFGSMHSFFEKLEAESQNLPVVTGERNYVFTGCYTSQAPIKRANRLSEERLKSAEILDVMAHSQVADYRTASPFAPAWKKVLFNQFHDIIPGSGTVETREYAMGQYQEALGVANVNATCAMRAICENIDTTALAPNATDDLSFGSGVGFGIRDAHNYGFSQPEHGGGMTRAYTIFNPTANHRKEEVELAIWDWLGDVSRMSFKDLQGNPISHQVTLANGGFFTNKLKKAVITVEVPPMGYTTVVLSQAPATNIPYKLTTDARVDRFGDMPLVLENSYLRAEFCSRTMKLVSFVDKKTGRERIGEGENGFRLITEATDQGMSSWRVGRYAKVQDISVENPVTVNKVELGQLRQSISFRIPFAHSGIDCQVILEANSKTLQFQMEVDWREFGNSAGIPQLNFRLPLKNPGNESLCVAPYGITKRPALQHDVPCGGLMAVTCDDKAVALISDCKYGYRFDGAGISVDLIRGSENPDPTPDIRKHSIRMGVCVLEPENEELLRVNYEFVTPLCYSSTPMGNAGTLPGENSLLSISGGVLCGLKQADCGDGCLIRLYNPTHKAVQAKVCPGWEFKEAAVTDMMENPVKKLDVKGKEISLNLPPYTVRSIYFK